MSTDPQIKTEKLFIDSLFEDSVKKKKVPKESLVGIKRLTGDASSRRYYRVNGKNTSYVVCLQPPFLNSKKDDFINLQSIYAENSVRVPKIYDYDLEKGYVLEEDLGDKTLLHQLASLEDPDCELKSYQKAIDELVKIQSIPRDKNLDEGFTKRFFDLEKLMWEVNFTCEHLVEGFLNTELGGKKDSLIKSFNKICQRLTEEKMVVTHRDFHSRNIMMKSEELIIIDFQDTRMGLPQYDLVSLLEDCYYKISSENKLKLKDQYYKDFIQPKGLQKSKEEFDYLYDLMAIQRVFKALGSFAYIYQQRKDIRYLKYIGYSFEKLREILFRHKEFYELRVILSEVYYEN